MAEHLQPATSPTRSFSLPVSRSSTILMLASSAGGPQALTQFMAALPPDLPLYGIIVQHMSIGFTALLANTLNSVSSYEIKEAETGDRLRQGQFLVAPGGYHLRFNAIGQVSLSQEPKVNSVRPAADVTMASLARYFGPQTLAVVLTGMGRDGLAGAQAIDEAGGTIFAQDEESSLVFGMPGAVVNAGLTDIVAPPKLLAHMVYAWFRWYQNRPTGAQSRLTPLDKRILKRISSVYGTQHQAAQHQAAQSQTQYETGTHKPDPRWPI